MSPAEAPPSLFHLNEIAAVTRAAHTLVFRPATMPVHLCSASVGQQGSSLTTEEWKTEQQLFAEAVSVNSSNISQAQCLAGIARREHLLSWRGYSPSAMNDEFDPGSG